jgi:hypothetical protein
MKPSKRDNRFAFVLLSSTFLLSLMLSGNSMQKGPSLPKSISQFRDGHENDVKEVYVPGLFTYPIVKQPEGDPLYVSNKQGLLTLFRSAPGYWIAGSQLFIWPRLFPVRPRRGGMDRIRRWTHAQISSCQRSAFPKIVTL